MNGKIVIGKGWHDKDSGFLISLDYISTLRACVLIGIYKRFYFQINKKCLNLGYLFIGYSNIISLLK